MGSMTTANTAGPLAIGRMVAIMTGVVTVLGGSITTGYFIGRNESAREISLLNQTIITHDMKDAHDGAVSRREIELVFTNIRDDLNEIQIDIHDMREDIDILRSTIRP